MAVVKSIVHPFTEEKGADRADLWWHEVDVALAVGRVSRARRFLRWILAARPDDEEAWLRLAELASSGPAQVAYLRRAYAFHPHSRHVQEALRQARARQLEAHGGQLERRLLALCRLPGKVASLPATGRTGARPRHSRTGARGMARSNSGRKRARGLRITAAVVCALLSMTLLPVLALPYGGLGWRDSHPAYDEGHSVPTPVQLPAEPRPAQPCVKATATARRLASRVNGQGISMEAIQREMAEWLSAMAISGADLQGEAVRARIPAFRRQALDRLIDDALVQQAAVEYGIAVPSTERVSGSSAGRIEASQQETGQAQPAYEQIPSRDRLRQAVLDRVTAGMGHTAEMVRARQIVLANKQDAWQVLVRLADGEDFGRIAKETTLDRRTRALGGDLGWLPRGLGWVAPEVEETAFAGEPGQIRGPVHVGDRYIIVQTLDHADDRPLDGETRHALQALDFERWLAGRREAAKIEILVDLDSSAP